LLLSLSFFLRRRRHRHHTPMSDPSPPPADVAADSGAQQQPPSKNGRKREQRKAAAARDVSHTVFDRHAWYHNASNRVALPLEHSRFQMFMVACNTTPSRVFTHMALDVGLLPLCISEPPLMRLLLDGCGCERCTARTGRTGPRRSLFTAQELFCQYMCAAMFHLCDERDQTLARVLERVATNKPEAKINGYERALKTAATSVYRMSESALSELVMQCATVASSDGAACCSPLTCASQLFGGTTRPGDSTDRLLAQLTDVCSEANRALVNYTLAMLNMAEMTLWSEIVQCSALPLDAKQALLYAGPMTTHHNVVSYMCAIGDQPTLKGALAEWTTVMTDAYAAERANPAYASERHMKAPPKALLQTVRERVIGYYAPVDAYVALMERLLCRSRAPAFERATSEQAPAAAAQSSE
jgi:hypothetical protein